ncbi:MAG: CDP-alcohol phosphatidyltransferase family protein [Anaerolineaceae bacterium]|jgi:archaetidylinositol phosphate synthase
MSNEAPVEMTAAEKKAVTPEKRINDILLGPLERPALQWMARRMPQWVSSDTMTSLGVVASVLIFVAYVMVGRGEIQRNPWLWVASLGFVLNWMGDSLDGTLARYRHMERPKYGFFVDHSVDAFSAVAIFLGIGFAKIASFQIASMALVGYLLAMITVYLKTHVTGIFEMTTIKIGPTEIRLIAIMINTYLFFAGNPTINVPRIGEVPVGDFVLGLIALLLGLYFLYQTIHQSRILMAHDELALARRKAKEAVREQKKEQKEERKRARKQERAAKNSS